ncbi:hypothetical protein EYR36_010012 [Pleurotus pulmonarius]|nr:hypothetical protein EYR36_010012 [Pleurotus pulmonarius]
MISVPPEIVLQIIENVDDRYTMLNCLLLSRDFKNDATRLLYRSVDLFSTTGELKKFRHAIDANPQNAHHVVHIAFAQVLSWAGGCDDANYILSKLPNLRSLKMALSDWRWEGLLEYLSPSVHCPWQLKTLIWGAETTHGPSALIVAHQGTLEHIELHYDACRAIAGSGTPLRGLALPNLRSIRLPLHIHPVNLGLRARDWDGPTFKGGEDDDDTCEWNRTSMMPPIPPEIVGEIIANVDATATLFNCLSVPRVFEHEVTRVLYKSVTLSGKQLGDFRRAIDANPQNALRVVSLTIREARSESPDSYDDLNYILSKLPNLKMLEMFRTQWTWESFQAFLGPSTRCPWKLTASIWRDDSSALGVMLAHQDTLEHIQLYHWACHYVAIQRWSLRGLDFPNLRSIRLPHSTFKPVALGMRVEDWKAAYTTILEEHDGYTVLWNRCNSGSSAWY